MQAFMTFLANHYIWFLLISFVLLFALIGYFLDSKEEPTKNEVPIEKIVTDQIETLENKPLNEMVGAPSKTAEKVPETLAGDIPVLMVEDPQVETFEVIEK